MARRPKRIRPVRSQSQEEAPFVARHGRPVARVAIASEVGPRARRRLYSSSGSATPCHFNSEVSPTTVRTRSRCQSSLPARRDVNAEPIPSSASYAWLPPPALVREQIATKSTLPDGWHLKDQGLVLAFAASGGAGCRLSSTVTGHCGPVELRSNRGAVAAPCSHRRPPCSRRQSSADKWWTSGLDVICDPIASTNPCNAPRVRSRRSGPTDGRLPPGQTIRPAEAAADTLEHARGRVRLADGRFDRQGLIAGEESRRSSACCAGGSSPAG